MVLALMLDSLLPDGRGANRQCAGYMGSFVMQEVLFLLLLL